MKKNVLICLVFSFALYAVPKDDFANVLNYAKFSSCENIAYKFNTLSKFDGFGKLIEKELNTKKENLLPWRFEITNGYKEGFFYYALLGYANELSGDIPFAYQCYRNATLYINEEKSFSFPEPTAEIYLGIARTCLAAGRYMDTKDWLDATYEYANDNPNILAAIDRVAIQRGNELGDYEDIILHYQHLEQVSRTTKCVQSPPFKGDLGGCKLTKPELANYAQILFWSRKDREGFSKLLEGISKNGIDNNLGVKDPLVDKFLNNIMRADNEEVEYFYDLLGYEIEAARAKAGDENYLAFLCNARTLFCKVYDFLDSENDLKKVKKRIDVVKEQLKQGYDVFGNETKSSRSLPTAHKRKIKKSKNRKISKTGKIEELPEVVLENLLMQADWYYKIQKYVIAKVMYDKAVLLSTGTFANLEYDGTTQKNAANMGSIFSKLQLNSKLKIHNSQFDFDSSFRAAELTLQLYQVATNDEQRSKYDTEAAIANLPKAYPMILNYLQKEAERFTKSFEFNKALSLYVTLLKYKANLSYKTARRIRAIYYAQGKTSEAFSSALNAVKYCQDDCDRIRIANHCLNTWSYATIDDLRNFSHIIKGAPLANYLQGIKYYSVNQCLRNAVNWQKEYYNSQLDLLRNIEQENYQSALDILTNTFNETEQANHDYQKAIVYANINKTNLAYKYIMKAYNKRCNLAKKAGGDAPQYPTIETSIIEPLLSGLETNEVIKYKKWLEKRKAICEKYKKNADVIQIEQAIQANKLLTKLNIKK